MAGAGGLHRGGELVAESCELGLPAVAFDVQGFGTLCHSGVCCRWVRNQGRAVLLEDLAAGGLRGLFLRQGIDYPRVRRRAGDGGAQLLAGAGVDLLQCCERGIPCHQVGDRTRVSRVSSSQRLTKIRGPP